jgi:acyl-CoA dehydrogenase
MKPTFVLVNRTRASTQQQDLYHYRRDRCRGEAQLAAEAIQHPLAECWMNLEAANMMMLSAAWQYDNGLPSGAAANTAKYLAAEAGFKACETAVMTLGGFGYAKEYHVERYLREILITRIAPISPQLILCYIAERVLGLPKSY